MSADARSLARLLSVIERMGQPQVAEGIRAEIRALRVEAGGYRKRLRALQEQTGAELEPQLAELAHAHHTPLLRIVQGIEAMAPAEVLPVAARDLVRTAWAFLSAYGNRTGDGAVVDRALEE